VKQVQKMGRKYPPSKAGRPPKHGVRALVRRIKENSLDRRTKPYRLLQEIANNLAADVGGWENLTERESLLVRNTAFLAVITNTIEDYALNKDPINKQGALEPILAKNLVLSN
jgi:hypothetical protein